MTRRLKSESVDEQEMRADESKQRRYERLLESQYFSDVVDANRAYVAAAIPDPERTERDYWALSCLPQGRLESTLSRISMRTMETFVLGPDDDGAGTVGFVMVARTVVEENFGSVPTLLDNFPDLDAEITDYHDAGDDQLRVLGRAADLNAVLWHERFASAASALAERVMQRRTIHWQGHNYLLADHVLGRA